MKLSRLMMIWGLGLIGVCGTALADDNGSGDPCGAVMCLSINDTAPWQCSDHVNRYFNIRVYHGKHHEFDPGATAIKRYQEVMDKCPDAEQSDKDKVNAMYGMLEYFPFGFY